MKNKLISKENLLKDFKKVYKKFIKEHSKYDDITFKYYKDNSEYNTHHKNVFGNFSNMKEAFYESIGEKNPSTAPSKEELIEDAREIYKNICVPQKIDFNRYAYKANSRFKHEHYILYFSSFLKFKEYFFELDGLDIDNKKKAYTLAEENKTLKKENEKILKKSIEEDLILDMYREKQLNLVLPNIKFTFDKESKQVKDNKEAILMLSDFHCGETVDSEQLGGLNEYNVEVMKKRIDRIFHYAIHYCKKYEISNINLLFLGDLMSGSIHPELLRTNEYNDVEVLFILHEYISTKLLEIEPHFKKINCEFLVGNHSRISDGNSGTKQQWKSASILNWEYVLARQLQMQFDLIQKSYKTKKIIINVNSSLFKVIEVAKRKFLITHGHTMSAGSNSFAGIGYYGLAMSSAKMLGAMISTKDDELVFQDILMGHLHTTAKVKTTNGSMYINGSVIGSGEFGLYKMKAISEPEQTLLFVSNGKVNNEITLRGND